MEDLQIASSEKCPLCGGRVIFGECSFCGYAVPDTEQLSAPYDLSPDNVIFGDAEAPDDSEESIPTIDLPNVPSSPMEKLNAPAAIIYPQGNTAGVKNTANKARAASPASGAGTANNAKGANTAFVPYTKPENISPEYDSSDMSERVVKSVSDFVIRNWWKFLLTAILPSIGYGFAFFYFVINRDNDKERKKSELFFAGAILLTTILLQAVKWDPTGLDILIQYLIKYFLTRVRYYRYR